MEDDSKSVRLGRIVFEKKRHETFYGKFHTSSATRYEQQKQTILSFAWSPPPVNQAMNNAWFEKQGLINLMKRRALIKV